MNDYIENLRWRYATKVFDPNRKISPDDLAVLKEAVRLSASSYGLQPYRVLVIRSEAVREQLRPISWGQSQITDASHLFLFVNNTQIGDREIEDHIVNTAKIRGIAPETLNGYGDFVKSKITPLPTETKNHWTAKQAYIAMGNLLSAAAFLRIDTCPIEGFETEKVNKLLGLNKKGYSAAVMVAAGYRNPDDKYQHLAKVRVDAETLFEEV